MGSRTARISLAIGLMVLANCAAAGKPKPKPVPTPPPPPPVVYIPPRPTPPLGASPNVVVPAVSATGVRQTVNVNLTPSQTVWNLRSAYNVAALNCLGREYAEILDGYKAFLKVQKLGLAKANSASNAEFRQRYGAAFLRSREAYMTKVYNYYAFPPTLHNFCDAALAMARESKTIKPADLGAFSRRGIVALDAVFENFYRSYEQYRADAAAWDAKYAPATRATATAPAAMPGPAAPVVPAPKSTAKPSGS